MTEPVEALDKAAPNKHKAAPPSRSKSLISGITAKPRTMVSILAALVLGMVAALVGPLGTMQSAYANDGNPMFHIGADDGYRYVQFINSIRARVNDGGRTFVQGAGNAYLVDHTRSSVNLNTHAAYVQVDIQMWGNDHFVRLQLRRDNLYILGWWDEHNDYHYMGNRTPPLQERERMHDGGYRDARDAIRTPFEENYVSMETAANEHRANMAISRDSINGAAWYLYNANNNQNMARGVLRMAQFIAEAARFRPIRDNIAGVIGFDAVHFIPPQLVSQENQWGHLSGRFNWLLSMPQGYRDPHPLHAVRRGTFGEAVSIVLYTAAQYAHYVLSTSKGR
ncbi:ribosome-inactivating family protein [Streptomyces sp. CA-210063]|uniref:ribosome-inactivating family protein n=1 Tax=Streptomyces sp. CA-210063 TaxID=2801029 RepID=UPI00214A90C3|nr:ribosome-inactivating family protein [Streptomyces sp. CA-210063]UUU29412.1 ribosome-inactivating family protein [Streptomyces sp. CA-210063]